MSMLVIPNRCEWLEVVPSLVNKAEEMAAASTDYTYNDFDNAYVEMTGKLTMSVEGNSYELTDYAASQLCGRIGMPIQYYKKLIRSSLPLQDLAITNVNTLMEDFHGSMMFRTTNNSIRGVLSDKYVPFDTHEILEVFTDTMGNLTQFSGNPLGIENVMFRGTYMSPDRFHMRFTTAVPMENAPDRDIYAGLQIDSSDVGKAKLTVRYYLFKQICTNGMCISLFDKEFFTQRHAGNITKDDFAEGLRKSLIAFPIVAEQSAELLQNAGRFSLRYSPIFDMDNNQAVQKALQVYFRVTDEELLDIVDIAKTFYPKTVWGFANAVTHKAREFSFERRNTVETLAGNFLFDYRRLGIA